MDLLPAGKGCAMVHSGSYVAVVTLRPKRSEDISGEGRIRGRLQRAAGELQRPRESASAPATERRDEGGGEGGIRTHVPVTRQDAFEAPPLRPLRYLSSPINYTGRGATRADLTHLRRTSIGPRLRHQQRADGVGDDPVNSSRRVNAVPEQVLVGMLAGKRWHQRSET